LASNKWRIKRTLKEEYNLVNPKSDYSSLTTTITNPCWLSL